MHGDDDDGSHRISKPGDECFISCKFLVSYTMSNEFCVPKSEILRRTIPKGAKIDETEAKAQQHESDAASV